MQSANYIDLVQVHHPITNDERGAISHVFKVNSFRGSDNNVDEINGQADSVLVGSAAIIGGSIKPS